MEDRTFIATFFSHFGTMRFKKACDERGIPARTMPVPRSLSSSCGTCTQFVCPEPFPYDDHKDELESIHEVVDGQYVPLYHATEE